MNKVCPQCKQSVPDQFFFCQHCGYQFPPAPVVVSATDRKCERCGYALGSFDRDCPQCENAAKEPEIVDNSPGAVPYGQCPSCRNWIPLGGQFCVRCGGLMGSQIYAPNSPQAMQPYRPKKDKLTAGLLGMLVGSLGIHHFYLGNIGAGILSVLFCWTYIPALIGFIQGIIFLCMSDEEFQRRHG